MSRTEIVSLRADHDHLVDGTILALLLSRDELLPWLLLLLDSWIALGVEILEEEGVGAAVTQGFTWCHLCALC